jgi:N6-adenosine-specific RNA methylase IME4
VKYRTIVADPPWEYNDGFAYLEQDGYRREELPYPSMSIEDICALPVAELRPSYKEGAALFLWTTNLYLRDAFDVIDAWGFRYRQTITWHKSNAMPAGGSVAPNAEFLLVARYGQHRWHGAKWGRASFTAPAHEHSAKSELFLDLIEQISPPPYLEMFARRNRIGWDTWGNEALDHGVAL